jgi:DNA-binding transcriptional LysR family regulator
MDTRYLRSLIAVVESGSIAKAARLENLTAAAVSQRIVALERQLGLELLVRVGHVAKPSLACMDLLPRARCIVNEVALLAGDVDNQGLTGPLRIGAISTVLTGLLPQALRSLTRSTPQLKPVIIPGTSRSLYQALEANELDAAIVVAPPFALTKTFDAVLLRKEPLVFISNEQSSLGIDARLQSCPYIQYDPDAWGGRHAVQYLQDQGLTPAALLDLDALETIALLTSEGLGVSLVPCWSGIERWMGSCEVEPVGDQRYDREIVLISHAQGARGRMVEALKLALQEKTQ